MTGQRWKAALWIGTLVLLAARGAAAVEIPVGALGDAGWISGDTRNNGSLDFVSGPGTPPLGPGSLHLTSPANPDKATLENRSLTLDLATAFESFEYAWFRTSGGPAAPALKFGIDTTEANPNSPTAIARGEDRFDKILVYEPYNNGPTADNAWTVESIDFDLGLWWLVNLTAGSAMQGTNQADLRTLNGWRSLFGSANLLAGAQINSIQIGVGSFNANQDSYVDYFMIASDSGSTTWNFGAAAVPEPASVALLGLALLGLGAGRRARRG